MEVATTTDTTKQAKKLPVVKFKQTNPAGKKRKPIGEKKIIDISRDDGEDDMEERLFTAGPRKRPELALVTENMKAALSTRAKRVEISEAEKDKLRRRITTAKRQDAEVARKKRKIVRLRRSLGRYTADTAGVLAALSGRIDEHWAQLQYVQGLEPKPAEKKKRKQTKKTDIIVIRKRKHSAVDQQKKKKADVVAPTEAVKTSKPTKKRAKKDVAPKPKITIIRAGAVAKKRKPVKKIQGDAVTKTAE